MNRGFVALAALVFLAGCASSGVTRSKSSIGNEAIPQPTRLVIGEFSADPNRIPTNPEIARYFVERTEAITPEEIDLGRRLGQRIEAKLVKDLQGLGIKTEPKATAGPLALNDGLLEGHFVTVNEGSRLKRVVIGFGAGAAELRTLVESYQMTDSGLRQLGFSEIKAEGGSMPGMIVPLGVGGATGELGRSALIGGGVAVAKEVTSESIEAAAERTASTIAERVKKVYQERGWLP